jgi:hypothetical protein
MLIVLVEEKDRFRDGGTIIYEDVNGTKYFKDGRIGSITKGKIFDRYPNEPTAKELNVQLEIIGKS